MKITKIKLKSNKRFKDLTIDLTKHKDKKIIALVGKNGAGKSAIFDAFNNYNWGWNRANIFFISSLETNENDVRKINFSIRSSYRFNSIFDSGAIGLNSVPKNMQSIDFRFKTNAKEFHKKISEDIINNSGKKSFIEIDSIWKEKINKILKKILKIEITKTDIPFSYENFLKDLEFLKNGLKLNFSQLSSGEKEVVDLILHCIIYEHEKNIIFCIEEPELHINSSIQKDFLIEISKLIPKNSQLWITTHSFGFINTLISELKEESAIIHLSNENNVFNHNGVITPIEYTKKNIKKILALPLLEMSKFIFPKKVFICEGKFESIRKVSDAEIYETIFKNKLDDILFISKGGYAAVKKFTESLYESFFNVVDTKWISLVDGDAEKDDKNKITETIHLKRRAIENYLFDLEILKKINPNIDTSIFNSLCLDIKNCDFKNKQKHIQELCNRKNTDKRAFLYELIKKITPKTQVYKDLRAIIFKK